LLKWFSGLALASYVGVTALLYVFQRDIQYRPPQTVRTAPATVGFPAEEIILDTADGEKVVVWHAPARAGKLVVLYFHGNGDVLALRVPRLRESPQTAPASLRFRTAATQARPGGRASKVCSLTRRRPMHSPQRAMLRTALLSGAFRSAPGRRLRSLPSSRSANSSLKRPTHQRSMSRPRCFRFCQSDC